MSGKGTNLLLICINPTQVQVHHLISLGGWNDVIHLSIYPTLNLCSSTWASHIKGSTWISDASPKTSYGSKGSNCDNTPTSKRQRNMQLSFSTLILPIDRQTFYLTFPALGGSALSFGTFIQQLVTSIPCLSVSSGLSRLLHCSVFPSDLVKATSENRVRVNFRGWPRVPMKRGGLLYGSWTCVPRS
jgi:hypothetical protein